MNLLETTSGIFYISCSFIFDLKRQLIKLSMEPSEEQPNYILPEGLFLDSKLPAIILANIIAIEDRMFAFESLPTKIV